MTEFLNQLTIMLIAAAADYPIIGAMLVVIGGIVAVATVLKPLVYVVVNWTKTPKNNVVADKFYGIIEGTAIDFKPFVELFKKKYPKAGAFEIKDKTDV